MLSDEEKRKQYDQFGHQAGAGGGPGPGFHFNFEDIFRNFDFGDDFEGGGPFQFFGGGHGNGHHHDAHSHHQQHHQHHNQQQKQRAGFFSFGDFFQDVSNHWTCNQ